MRAIVLVPLLLCGCSLFKKETAPALPPVTNEQKDNYIKKVEQVVSDSASAIIAVSPSLPQGVPRKLLDNTAERLSGVSKPSVERTKEYERMVRENDSKGAKKDEEEAKKVEQVSADLKRRAEEAESQLALQELMTAAADEEAQREIKNKQLWQYSTAGLGLFVAGVLAVAFTPFKKNGAVLMLGGIIGMSVAWVFDSAWFPWVVGTAVSLSALSGLFLLGTWVWERYKSR
jgi:hypothetical protein